MSESNINRPGACALFWFAVLTAVATFLLLGAGGLVTSNEAGMSVPDWPNSYGYNMFLFPPSKWIGGIFYEHTHRLWATVVGAMTTILALWIFGKSSRPFMRWLGLILPVIGIVSELLFPDRWLDGVLYGATGLAFYFASFVWPRRERSANWLCWLGIAAFLLVVAQGVLGGLRVVLKMDDLGGIHGVVAQTFFVLMCAIALFTSGFWRAISEKKLNVPGPLRTMVLMTTILIFCQLIMGSMMRAQHAGLSINTFPSAYGKFWPDTSPDAIAHYNARRMEVTNVNDITAFQVILQMVHRIFALAVFIFVVACAIQALRLLGMSDALAKFAFFWLGLILAQIGLGAATILTNKAADVATAHVLVGALSLVTGALWCIIAFGRSARVPAAQTEAFGAFGTLAGNK
jgi:heme a synthase